LKAELTRKRGFHGGTTRWFVTAFLFIILVFGVANAFTLPVLKKPVPQEFIYLFFGKVALSFAIAVFSRLDIREKRKVWFLDSVISCAMLGFIPRMLTMHDYIERHFITGLLLFVAIASVMQAVRYLWQVPWIPEPTGVRAK
jgi:hypothetical protein